MLHMESCVGFAMISAVTLGVDLPVSSRMASRGFSWPDFESCRRLDNRRRYAGRRFASVVSDAIPTIIDASYGILCRRQFASIVSYVIPGLIFGLWDLVSASVRLAS